MLAQEELDVKVNLDNRRLGRYLQFQGQIAATIPKGTYLNFTTRSGNVISSSASFRLTVLNQSFSSCRSFGRLHTEEIKSITTRRRCFACCKGFLALGISKSSSQILLVNAPVFTYRLAIFFHDNLSEVLIVRF